MSSPPRRPAPGATIETETPVAVRADGPAVASDGFEQAVDAVVVAAGAETSAAFESLEVPLETYESTIVIAEGTTIEEPMLADRDESFYLRPHERGVLIGADGRKPLEPEELCGRAGDRLGASLEPVRSWTGECTTTPDTTPAVGELEPGVYVRDRDFDGARYSRLAPAIGEHIASMVLDGESIEAYNPQRF
ncbi:MAG: FAD-dependent oxidoreductase [Natrialbaceae archaeon]|nr:FAD-dependent oxidoreductase [Natrialbaceae archaeon]